MAKGEKVEVVFEGTSYTWANKRWYNSQTFITPPEIVIRELDKRLPAARAKLERAIPQEKITTTDVDELLHQAGLARDNKHHVRAERFVRHALKIKPGHPPSLAVLCSVLRAKGLSRQALDETEPYRHLSYPPLITSRAAALCDLGEWTKAKKELSRALAMGGDSSAFAVLRRIKANRPELYD